MNEVAPLATGTAETVRKWVGCYVLRMNSGTGCGARPNQDPDGRLLLGPGCLGDLGHRPRRPGAAASLRRVCV
jgi:hypothetical protein